MIFLIFTVQESIAKENENYKNQITAMKAEREEAQQKWLVLEQIVKHYKKEEKDIQKDLENKLFVQSQLIAK